MRKALFFDFWGTLWLPGPDEKTIEAVALEACIYNLAETEADAILKIRRFGGAPAPGVCQVIRKFAQVCPLFIISHSPMHTLADILKLWQLWNCFEAVASTHSLRDGKVEIFNRLILEHQVQPIVYIGDSYGDVITAQEVGVLYFHLGKQTDLLATRYLHAAHYESFQQCIDPLVRLCASELGSASKG